MRYAACFYLVACAAAQLQYGQHTDAPGSNSPGSSSVITYMSSVYTISIFDPSNALTYGASKTTINRPSIETTESARHSHSSSSHKLGSSAVTKTQESSSATAPTLEASVSPSSSAASSVPPAPAEQTIGAASRIYSCGAGVMAGCVLAWIALL
ncbi:hypothetical protein DPSP01_003899 [Paraphaeosphaeria sporulosa]|uniref:Uncharacterized protein n=1 Tax=Paraphaeosphaeria sporulosa TaxID=1460663 RepID=A0A177C895_9PLEO|nr:uncharacterized protein CC84DRAFT_1166758 [Paraphaeosphaeria sporulosa]OAG02977.1 hypothetical protein CC84DRAFT_1166758 [Paraphaeosphaeria sporulosa]